MISRMESNDIPEVVRLHKKALAGDFFVLLGGKFLSALYMDIINSRDAKAFVFSKDNRIVGFAAVCADQGGFYRRFMLTKFFTLI
ncbi:MAG: hypothetical protein COY78_09255, partial [Candidatus Omnitrophica bacterium CG_4_10_14_0_8_um_filter_44_12]